ncbi:asparagine synthase (glutamine-hydrolyzing) [Magnetospirillum molischianum]|uniref:asparagine synthase (glutamine-hydrolyzing) n=1 Tax=Magnetospirillum molischianum DSM 120 TaxID=1150626 RepID=H8FPU5_MAGML|nr:asparagine synthase (glutamine-hydrolyzing) [Magnetospirillum molischianum]CCG40383.1 Asparagine synthase, glutamine-hydrolyzing [Magnetospirillum molischianum DSM 120]
MCGIAGVFSSSKDFRVDESTLHSMARRLVHRGPDESGDFIDAGIGFGFTRLAIIDLATGNQPHSNEDGSVVSICNGEIYNFKELREDLEQRGHRFRTRCDVEIIVHLYEEYGPGCVSRLNGQFAIALYDRTRHALLLARDHVGIAPLFHTRIEGAVLFASEIKALLAHPAVRPTIDPAGLDQILTFPGLVSPTTMFAGIEALPPGHYLYVEAGRPAIPTCYWDLDYPELGEADPVRPDSYYSERVEDLLLTAVRRRLNADVPVGFYLSGGLDSSLIGAMTRVVQPQQRLHSFSITFPEADIDERRYQRAMADHLGSLHHEAEFTPDEIADRLRRAVICAETPLKESYNTCSLALSALARESGHKVILTGEGADELFAGYVGYRLDATGARSGGAPDDIETMLEDELRQHLWGQSDFFYDRDYLPLREVKASLYSEALAVRQSDFEATRQPVIDTARLRNRHPLHQRSYVDFKLRLSDHLLADHGDRVTYANSIEARYPFLDIDLIAFARTIPPELLIRNSTEKYVLRQVAGKYLPDTVAKREKFGFVAPGSPYLLARNIDWINDILDPSRIKRQNYFNPEAVERLRSRFNTNGARINTTFESDFLMIIITFGILLDEFSVPDFSS